MISATIFWIFFAYIPKRKRIRKIRPKVNQDLEIISSSFLEIFRELMGRNNLKSYKIIEGSLSKEDFTEFMIGKKFYNHNVEKPCYQINSTGKTLKEASKRILNKINELYHFTEILEPEEIIILERIKKTILVYDFSKKESLENFKSQNLTFLGEYFYDQYILYLDLLEITFTKKTFIKTTEFYDIMFPLTQIDFYYYNKKNYRHCIKLCKTYKNDFPKTQVFKIRRIFCEYQLKRKNRAFKFFKELMTEEKHLSPYSNIIFKLKNFDSRILPYLKDNYSEEKLSILERKLDSGTT